MQEQSSSVSFPEQQKKKKRGNNLKPISVDWWTGISIRVRVCVCVFPSCSEGLLEDFLLVCHNETLPQRAVELVQFSATFCLPATHKLATSALADFDLTDEQRWGRGYQQGIHNRQLWGGFSLNGLLILEYFLQYTLYDLINNMYPLW